ncbi:MAG: hypothetical protein V4687_00910 [Bacteroidota bacterium]
MSNKYVVASQGALTIVDDLFPFTAQGVQDLLSHLYQLPQDELKAEAEGLSLDFRLWMLAHFQLAPSRVKFLNRIDNTTIAFAAMSCSLAIENRLPIILDKVLNQTKDEDPPFKNLKVISTLTSSYGGTNPTGLTGDVTIRIRYEH